MRNIYISQRQSDSYTGKSSLIGIIMIFYPGTSSNRNNKSIECQKNGGLISSYRTIIFQKGYCSNKYKNFNQNRAVILPYPRTRLETVSWKPPKDVLQLYIIFNIKKMLIDTVNFILMWVQMRSYKVWTIHQTECTIRMISFSISVSYY